MQKLMADLACYRAKLNATESNRLSDEMLNKLHNVYPFNKFEYLVSHLIADGVMSIADYSEIRADYIDRNKFLYLFEMAPRTFGEEWGERHLMEIEPDFKLPRPSIDPDFAGEYDLWLDGIKVEVKASRAVRRVPGEALAEKALSFGTEEHFDMNFQQLKPDCCDVFVWIAVWRNHIDYWIFTSDEVKSHPSFSNQHRASQLDGEGKAVEGQIHINNRNYDEFEKFKVRPNEIRTRILEIGIRPSKP